MRRLLACLVLLCLSATLADAQETRGNINGTVQDSTGVIARYDERGRHLQEQPVRAVSGHDAGTPRAGATAWSDDYANVLGALNR